MEMKKLLSGAILAMAVTFTTSAWAVSYNVNDTAIFGSGNPDTGWTVNDDGGVILGARGKQRDTGNTANVNGVYGGPLGFVVANRGYENFEFSVDTGSSSLLNSGLNFWVGFDTDPSAGTSMNYFSLAALTDSWYGSDATANGGGTVGTYALAAVHSEMQNSINQFHLGVNPLVDGTYNYELFATRGTLSSDTRVNEVEVTIKLGAGGASVPDTGSTLAMLGVVAGGLGFARRKLA